MDADQTKIDPSQTTIFHKKTREERKQELQELLLIPEGLEFLTHIYKAYFSLPAGKPHPSATIMIARIVSKEYADMGRRSGEP